MEYIAKYTAEVINPVGDQLIFEEIYMNPHTFCRQHPELESTQNNYRQHQEGPEVSLCQERCKRTYKKRDKCR